MYIIVGLGNPGNEYKNTRHNVGFMVIDRLGREHAIKPSKKTRRYLSGQGSIAGESVQLVTPTTFMNNSGLAVREALRSAGVGLDRLIVIYDDLDLDFGRVRIRNGGGSGGHNGVKSIIAQNGGGDFIRVRIGIGRPPGRMDTADYVLSSFAKVERGEVDLIVAKAADAVGYILENGVEKAMNEFNK